MTDVPTTPQNGGNPSSWRDVYTLVQDVESRLTKRMDEIASTASVAVQDHEVRIRVLERTDFTSEVRTKTVANTLSLGRSTLLTIMSVGSMVVAVVSLVTR